ncbi:hypothetical protein B0H66DRAFT_528504 [Apodospora peruviana]|uniref:Uncharacterized protein n=1 Tax=Apodospora peruviana TaxID=516989 RepID=A0AAE0ITU8_9PEZI|nr:hypothetical protein B0H66DRAFT_528504 [Apodospora peruviana]
MENQKNNLQCRLNTSDNQQRPANPSAGLPYPTVPPLALNYSSINPEAAPFTPGRGKVAQRHTHHQLAGAFEQLSMGQGQAGPSNPRARPFVPQPSSGAQQRVVTGSSGYAAHPASGPFGQFGHHETSQHTRPLPVIQPGQNELVQRPPGPSRVNFGRNETNRYAPGPPVSPSGQNQVVQCPTGFPPAQFGRNETAQHRPGPSASKVGQQGVVQRPPGFPVAQSATHRPSYGNPFQGQRPDCVQLPVAQGAWDHTAQPSNYPVSQGTQMVQYTGNVANQENQLMPHTGTTANQEQQPGPYNRPPRPYKPSHMVINPQGKLLGSEEERRRREELGISINYAGDINNPRNISANIPDEDNCSFWITHIHPEAVHKDILDAVRNVGRIYAMHLNKDQEGQRGKRHEHGAAKLVFFTKGEATRFWDKHGQHVNAQPLIIRGMQTVVRRNRNKVAEQLGLPPNRTRVLLITGPPHLVNEEFLIPWFQSKFKFEIDDILWHVRHPEVNMMEWRFSSFRSQAQSAFLALSRQEPPFDDPRVGVKWDDDPCDIPKTEEVKRAMMEAFHEAKRAREAREAASRQARANRHQIEGRAENHQHHADQYHQGDRHQHGDHHYH